MLFLLIYSKQTLFLFSFSPRIYMCFLYIARTLFCLDCISLYRGKQYFSYIDAFSFLCFYPEFRDVYIYIQEPFSFFLIYCPVIKCFLYIVKTLFFFVFCLEISYFYIYIVIFLYIQHRHSFSFQFLPRGISLYGQYLIYCLDFPYIYTILPIQTTFLFYLAQIFPIYIGYFFFSLFCPEMCIFPIYICIFPIQLFLFLYMFCPSIFYIQLIAFIFSYIAI